MISVPISYRWVSYGCGIVGGRIGGWGIEGETDRVVRNGSKDGLAASVGQILLLFKVVRYLVSSEAEKYNNSKSACNGLILIFFWFSLIIYTD
jgi:hypothetical protein